MITQIYKKIILLSVLLLLTSTTPYIAFLNNWTFSIENDTRQYKGNVPSTLADDLIANGLVSSDPYYRDNFLKFYDYETKDASYQTTFNVSSTPLYYKYQYLVF